jgi:hypothetical protein
MLARRRLLFLSALACAACLPAAGADAAGPPLPSAESGTAGAVAPGGPERLITRRAGEDTLVAAVRRRDGRTLRSRHIAGRWSVPAVTLDGATTGLSADGRTLVLARPTHDFRATSTRLAVLDTRQLLVRRRVELPGFFTVDAISPDGRWLYLIQYGGNVLDYAVRALDTRTGRLAAREIVDPRAPDEQMGGLPMTRATSRDGRWVYTLYGGGEETFIHALDTVGQTAACIDLDMLPPESDMSAVRLHSSADGRRIEVRASDGLVATVDAGTFEVSEPGATAAARPAGHRAVESSADGRGFPWPALVLVAAAGAIAVVIARRRGGSLVG